jgi:hypothetical protein
MTRYRGYIDDDGNDRSYGDDHDRQDNRNDDGHCGHHRHHDDDDFVHRFGPVDGNAIDPSHPGQMYFGSGNLATGYNIADNAEEHVEVALKVHPRGGADQTPTFDSHRNPVYAEAAGLQITTPGHERANWNFDFSADTALGGGKHTLSSSTSRSRFPTAPTPRRLISPRTTATSGSVSKIRHTLLVGMTSVIRQPRAS